MSSIVTNGKSFPGTTIDYNTNLVSVSFGNSLSINTGIIDYIYLGAKTIFNAGAQTSVNLGPQSTFTYGNVMSATWGDSWSWNATNNTVYDASSRWAAVANDNYGGMDEDDYGKRWVEEAQGYLIAIATLTTYVTTVGVALVGIQNPPFRMTGQDDNGDATGAEADAWWSIITSSLSVILMALGQFWMVKYITTHKKWNAVSKLSLCGDGLTSFVYTDPNNAGQNANLTFTKSHLWSTLADSYKNLIPSVVHTTLINNQNPVPSTISSGSDQKNSPYASIVMRPGSPAGEKNYFRSNSYIKNSDKNPIITLTASESLEEHDNKTETSYIRILPSEVFISSQLGPVPSLAAGFEADIDRVKPNAAIQVTNGEHCGAVNISNNLGALGGAGLIMINSDETKVDRTDGTITICTSNDKKIKSSLSMTSDNITLSSDITPSAKINMNNTGVVIGSGEYQVQALANSLVMGRTNNINITSGGVVINNGNLIIKP